MSDRDVASALPLERKYEHLQAILRAIGSALIAFSGGVDSTLLLKVAHDTLGDRAIAATADSETYYSVKHESLDTNVSVSCGHWRW